MINFRFDVVWFIDDGYEVSIEYNYFVMCNVLYVISMCDIKCGMLVLILIGFFSEVVCFFDYVIMFVGDYFCDVEGRLLEKFCNVICNEKVVG